MPHIGPNHFRECKTSQPLTLENVQPLNLYWLILPHRPGEQDEGEGSALPPAIHIFPF